MPNHALKTPLLVPLPATFEQYLENASKRCRYEYHHAPKLDHREVDFDIDLAAYWMALWEQQPIRGGYPKWRRYTPVKCAELAEKGILKMFYADIALQMVEQCDHYIYCHPPLYDKQNPVAKSMWFALIKWACGKADWLDLGGGQQRYWDELKRDKNYKWLYVPKNIEAKHWKVQLCRCGWRELISEPHTCSRCTPR
ncbi:MAG: hypothetical protein V3U60_11105 [Gammaproteobacteria bacterium]